MSTRILHISDLHFLPSPADLTGADLLWSKRWIGGLNMVLRRFGAFREAPSKVATLAGFIADHRIDFVACSGDLTCLGTRGELQSARKTLGPVVDAVGAPRFVVVPGNHDLYVGSAAMQDFVLTFSELMHTDRPDLAAPGSHWPVVKKIGSDAAVVAVCSAEPHRAFWRADGTVPPSDIEAVRRTLADPQLRDRTVVLLVHHAPVAPAWYLNIGVSTHGLANGADLVAATRVPGRSRPVVVAHGHIHRRSVVTATSDHPAVFCCGSTTYAGREGLWVYEIADATARAIPGHWAGTRYELDEASAVTIASPVK